MRNNEFKNRSMRPWLLGLVGVYLLLFQQIRAAQLTYGANGIIYEIGANDPSACATLGSTFFMQQDRDNSTTTFADWNGLSIVSGKTYSPTMVQPNTARIGCYSRAIPFIMLLNMPGAPESLASLHTARFFTMVQATSTSDQDPTQFLMAKFNRPSVWYEPETAFIAAILKFTNIYAILILDLNLNIIHVNIPVNANSETWFFPRQQYSDFSYLPGVNQKRVHICKGGGISELGRTTDAQMTLRHFFDVPNSSSAKIMTYNPHGGTKYGCTALYTSPKAEIFVWLLWMDTAYWGSNSAIEVSIPGQDNYTSVSIRTAGVTYNYNYLITHITQDSYRQDFVNNHHYYLLGQIMEFSYYGEPSPPYGPNTNSGKAALYRFQFNPPVGVPILQNWLLDMRSYNFGPLQNYYGKFRDFFCTDNLALLMTIETVGYGNLDYIGGNQNYTYIISVVLERALQQVNSTHFKYLCELDDTTFCISALAGQTDSQLSFTNMVYIPQNGRRSMRSFGASCRSSTTGNYCKIINALFSSVSNGYTTWYLAETATKASNSAGSEAIEGYYGILDGTQAWSTSYTNNGASSLILVSSRKHPDDANQDSSRYHSGVKVLYSHYAYLLVGCNGCGTTYPNKPWLEIFNLSPIGGGSAVLTQMQAIPASAPEANVQVYPAHQYYTVALFQNNPEVSLNYSILLSGSLNMNWATSLYNTKVVEYRVVAPNQIVQGVRQSTTLLNDYLFPTAGFVNQTVSIQVQNHWGNGSLSQWQNISIYAFMPGYTFDETLFQELTNLTPSTVFNAVFSRSSGGVVNLVYYKHDSGFTRSIEESLWFPTRMCNEFDLFTIPSSMTFSYDISWLPVALTQGDLNITGGEVLVTMHNYTDYSQILWISNADGYFYISNPGPDPNKTRTNENVILAVTTKDCVDTYYQGAFYEPTQSYQFPVQTKLSFVNAYLTITDCKNATLTQLSQFVFNWTKNTGVQTLFGNLASYFTSDQSPCTSKMYFTLLDMNGAMLPNNDQIMLRTGTTQEQALSSTGLNALSFDTSSTSYLTTTYQFQLALYLNGAPAAAKKGILHSQTANVTVNLGCYSTALSMSFSESANIHQSPHFLSSTLNTSNSILTVNYLFRKAIGQNYSHSILLSDIISYSVQTSYCDITKIEGFVDGTMTAIATSANMYEYLIEGNVTQDPQTGRVASPTINIMITPTAGAGVLVLKFTHKTISKRVDININWCYTVPQAVQQANYAYYDQEVNPISFNLTSKFVFPYALPVCEAPKEYIISTYCCEWTATAFSEYSQDPVHSEILLVDVTNRREGVWIYVHSRDIENKIQASLYIYWFIQSLCKYESLVPINSQFNFTMEGYKFVGGSDLFTVVTIDQVRNMFSAPMNPLCRIEIMTLTQNSNSTMTPVQYPDYYAFLNGLFGLEGQPPMFDIQAHSDNLDYFPKTFVFWIKTMLRSSDYKAFWNPGGQAKVNITIGCYYELYVNITYIPDQIYVSHVIGNVKNSSGTFVSLVHRVYPFSMASYYVYLHDFLTFQTDIYRCFPAKYSSYTDSSYSVLTALNNPTYLGSNPWLADPYSQQYTRPYVWINYGLGVKPSNAYIRVETQGINSTNIVSANLILDMQFCTEKVQLVNSSQQKIEMIQTTNDLQNLTTYFLPLTYQNPVCEGIVYFISSNDTANVPAAIGSIADIKNGMGLFDTWNIGLYEFYTLANATGSNLLTAQPVLLNVTSLCYNQSMVPPYFVLEFFIQKNKELELGQIKKLYLSGDEILQLFGPQNLSPYCPLSRYYLAPVGNSTELDFLDPISMIMQRREDTENTSALEYNVSFGVEDVSIEFDLRLILGFNNFEFLHPQIVTVKMNFSCYEEKITKFWDYTAGETVDFLNYTDGILYLQYKKGEPSSSVELHLSELFSLQSDYMNCGAFNVSSFSDEGYSTATSAADSLGLKVNPTERDELTYLIDPILVIKYDENGDIINGKVFLQAMVDTLEGYEPVIVKTAINIEMYPGPILPSKILDQKLIVNELKLESGSQPSSFNFTSQKVTSLQTRPTTISINYTISDPLPCQCLNFTDNTDGSFTLQIDLTQVTSKDQKVYMLKVTYSSSNSPETLSSTFKLDLSFVAKPPPPPELPPPPPPPSPSEEEDNKTEDKPTEEEKPKEEKSSEEKKQEPPPAEEKKEAKKADSSAAASTWVPPDLSSAKPKKRPPLPPVIEEKPYVKPPEPPRVNLISLGSKGELSIQFSNGIVFPESWKKKMDNDIMIKELQANNKSSTLLRELKAKSKGQSDFIEMRVQSAAGGNPTIITPDQVSIESMTSTSIDMKITYNDPAEISMSDQSEQDKLELKFDPQMLTGENGLPLSTSGMDVDENGQAAPTNNIQPMVDENSQEQAALDEASDSVFNIGLLLTILQFMLTYILSTSLGFFWNLINSQINFIYMPLLNVNPPGQVSFYFDILIYVCTFDPIPWDIVKEILPFFEFDKVGLANDKKTFPRIGIEDRNFVGVLGSMIVFMIIFAITQAIYLILKPFKQKSHHVRKIIKYFEVESFYRTIIIVFFVEAYLDLLLGGIVNTENENYFYMELHWGPQGFLTLSDQFSIVLGYIIYIGCMMFPFVATIILENKFRHRYLTRHQNHMFDKFYEVLYEGLKVDRPGYLQYFSIYLIRKFLFAHVVYYGSGDEFCMAQCMLCLHLSFFFMLYLAYCQPFLEKSNNVVQIMNEACMYIVCFLYLTFTDFNPVPEQKILMGWFLVLVVILNLIWPNGYNMIVGIWPDIKNALTCSCCRMTLKQRKRRQFVRQLENKRRKFILDHKFKLKPEYEPKEDEDMDRPLPRKNQVLPDTFYVNTYNMTLWEIVEKNRTELKTMKHFQEVEQPNWKDLELSQIKEEDVEEE